MVVLLALLISISAVFSSHLKVKVDVTSEKEIVLDGIPLLMDDMNIVEMLIRLLKKSHKVGDVIQSVLSPIQFAEVHGNGWALLDGKPLNKSSKLYDITGWANLPNATTRYFLMDQNDEIPTYVKYVNQSSAAPVDYGGLSNFEYVHSHAVDGSSSVSISGGNHNHNYDRIYVGCCVDGAGSGSNRTIVASGQVTDSSSHHHPNSNFGGHTESSGIVHEHDIVGWDEFTRPSSTPVNSFIRID